MISRKWLKRVAGAVVLSLLTTTVWLVAERAWLRGKGNRDLAAAFAETEAADPDWRWAALDAKRSFPPPDRNSADMIRRGRELTPPKWGQFVLRKTLGTELLPPDPLPNERFPADQIEAARGELAEVGRTLQLVRSLKDFPLGNRRLQLTPDVFSTLLPDTQWTRDAAAILRWDAVLAVEDADTGRAADALLALLNASRSVGDEPFLISQLVRMATRHTATTTAEWTLRRSSKSNTSPRSRPRGRRTPRNRCSCTASAASGRLTT